MSRGTPFTFTEEQRNKYQQMIRNDVGYKTVSASIMEDIGMSASCAEKHYYKLRAITPVETIPLDEYTQMICNRVPRQKVLAVMMEEKGIGYVKAANRYSNLKKKAIKMGLWIADKSPELAPAPEVFKPVQTPPQKRASSLPDWKQEQINKLPNYPTVIQFKDAICRMPDMAHHTVAELKTAYKQTHKNLTW